MSPQSRLLAAGFGRMLEWWVTPDGAQVLGLVTVCDEMLALLTLSDEQAAANEG